MSILFIPSIFMGMYLIFYTFMYIIPKYRTDRQTCPTCRGKGTVIFHYHEQIECPKCKGKKRIPFE